VVDPDQRILLMRIAAEEQTQSESPRAHRELWVTLGGRIEPGESVLTAAERELCEETGIVDARVGPVVWYGEQVLRINGRPRLLKENFVLARCFSARLSDAGWTSEERQAIAEMRWWSLDELRATSEEVKPPRLAALLRELLNSLGREPSGVRTIPLR
jgi:8-oxo-dGTP pyrophosphatase MutT (NUDIX family)